MLDLVLIAELCMLLHRTAPKLPYACMYFMQTALRCRERKVSILLSSVLRFIRIKVIVALQNYWCARAIYTQYTQVGSAAREFYLFLAVLFYVLIYKIINFFYSASNSGNSTFEMKKK